MSIITNPNADPRHVAEARAQIMADALRSQYPGHKVRVDESIHSRFNVIIEVPFQVTTLTWEEREAIRQEAARMEAVETG